MFEPEEKKIFFSSPRDTDGKTLSIRLRHHCPLAPHPRSRHRVFSHAHRFYIPAGIQRRSSAKKSAFAPTGL